MQLPKALRPSKAKVKLHYPAKANLLHNLWKTFDKNP